jgi:hypothetical protein
MDEEEPIKAPGRGTGVATVVAVAVAVGAAGGGALPPDVPEVRLMESNAKSASELCALLRLKTIELMFAPVLSSTPR